METIQLLGTALGLATLAGINLYLTVFLTGMAIRYDWIALASEYQQLEILAHPAIIIVAGVMFLIEFFADKVPWLDSAWDTVHTFIRPVGGTLLAIQVLGESDPIYDVIVAMLACGLSLASHTIKAGTRVVVNGSPEPMTNVAVSLVEDVGVVGGLWLLWMNPTLALVIFILLLAVAWWFAPRLFRAARAKLWLAWHKLTAPAATECRVRDTCLQSKVPPDVDILLHRERTEGQPQVDWAAKCMVGKWKGVAPYKDAWLLQTKDQTEVLYLAVLTRFGRSLLKQVQLADFKWQHNPGFLSENLALYSPDKGNKLLLLFERSRLGVVELIIGKLNSLIPEADEQSPAATAGSGQAQLNSPLEGELVEAK